MNSILDGITRSGHSGMTNPAPHSPMRIQNKIHFDVVGPDGKIKQSVRDVENIAVTYGMTQLGKLMATSTAAGSSFAQTMAIGTGTTAAASTQSGLIASTQLCGAFSRSDFGNMTARYLGTFSSDGNASSIQEIGIFASNVGNNSMICRSVLTGTQSVNRGSQDQINVSYDLVVTTA